MQFDQIPQPLCSPFQLCSAVLCPVVAPLYSSLFVPEQLRPTSGRTVCAATRCVVAPEPGQQSSELMPLTIQAGTKPQIQNFSGNSIFAFAVATAVFQPSAYLALTQARRQKSKQTLMAEHSAAAPESVDWRTATATPEWKTAATVTVINLNSAADDSAVSADSADNSGLHGKNCISGHNAQQLASQKSELYQIDGKKHLVAGAWRAGREQAIYQTGAKRLFDAGYAGLMESFRPVLLHGLHSALTDRALTDLPGISAFSAGRSKYPASAQSGATTVHLSPSQCLAEHQQRQLTASVARCRPKFAVTRHQVAASGSVGMQQMQNIVPQQQKTPDRQNYFLKASHCFDLKKIRLLLVSEIIF